MKKRRKSPPRKPELVRRDGALCAAFVNTASLKRRPLVTWQDLLAWARQCGVVGSGEAEELARVAAERPAEAAIAVQVTRALRDRLERILVALAAGERPDPADIAALNVHLAAASRTLAPAASGYRWVRNHPGGPLERLLWPVLRSAAEVLASKYHRRVRRCGGHGCDLLFVDCSPGSPRKWCSRESCGDRARSRRRYYATIRPRREERSRQGESSSPASAGG